MGMVAGHDPFRNSDLLGDEEVAAEEYVPTEVPDADPSAVPDFGDYEPWRTDVDAHGEAIGERIASGEAAEGDVIDQEVVAPLDDDEFLEADG